MDLRDMKLGVDAARKRMLSASGTNEEMLALFDGITVTLGTIAHQLSAISDKLGESDDA